MRGNTITLPLAYGKTTYCGKLYQYDYGQRLLFTGVDLPETYEVHFANSEVGQSKTAIGTAEAGVIIPDEYLATGSNIHVWIYLHDSATDGETEYHGVIVVSKRAYPSDEEPTPEQQSAITQAIAALDTAVSRAEDAAEDAETAAEMLMHPSATAETLPTGSDATAEYHDGVFAFGLPAGAKGDKGDKGDTGEKGDKGDKGDPGEVSAAQLATALATKADVIISSATGAIASFTDGADDLPVRDLTVAIDPVQDLHGYDSPWPAGGGKNKIPLSLANYIERNQNGTWNNNVYSYNGMTFTVNNDCSITINGTASATAYFTYVKNNEGIAFPAGDYIIHKTGKTGINLTAVKNGSYWSSAVANDVSVSLSEEANIAFYSTITNGTSFSNFVLYPMFESGTTASDWQPYSNVCPITGWTGAKVSRTGKNLIRAKTAGRTTAGITFTVREDGSVVANGTATGSAWLSTRLGNRNLMTFVKAGTYTVSGGKSTNLICYLGGNYVDGSDIPGEYDKGTGVTVILTQDAWVYPQIQVYAGQTCDNIVFNFQLELGSTATAYEPYTGNTLSIDWESEAGTVYGGSLDVTTGVLTVDRAMWTGNTADMDNNEDYPGWRNAGIKEIVGEGRNEGLYSAVSNISPAITSGHWAIGANTRGSSGSGMLIFNRIYFGKNQTEWQALAVDVQIVIPLRTPQTYQLTPQEVKTLLGNNNIFSDTGDSSVTYPADTKLYIDGKIAAALGG